MDGVTNLDASIDVSLEESIDIFSEQLKVMGIYLERPIVQRQILMLALILLVAWLIPVAVRYWLRRRRSSRRVAQEWRNRINAASLIISPILALVFTQVLTAGLNAIDVPNGILVEALSLLWLWLAYRALLMVFYARFGKAFTPFHRRIFAPIFLLILGVRISRNFVNIRLVSDYPLFTFSDTVVTVQRFFSAGAVLYAFAVASWALALGLRRIMQERSTVDPGVIESVVTISRYVVIGIGLLIALYLLGVNMATLALIGGGLSIGVGFGLQNIIANFISGLVLLFEQSVLPGDVIEIDGQIGIVDHVNIRATTVRTLDNIEVLVPNETFITTEVTTLTKTNREIRSLLPVGVSYGSDPQEVRRVACTTAKRHGLILDYPEPELLFRGFGDSSLNFDLAIWIDKPQQVHRVRSDIYYMLWEAFAKNNIEIPFPQRDLNLGNGWEKIRAPVEEPSSLGIRVVDENRAG